MSIKVRNYYLDVIFFIVTFMFFFYVENGAYRILITSTCFLLSIILFLSTKKVFPRRLYPVVFILITVITYLVVEQTFRGDSYNYLFFIAILSLISAVFYSIFLYENKYRINFEKYIKIILYFHITTFVLQFLMWYTLKIDLDYLYYLGIETTPQRSYFYGIYRATGIYAEPSIYSSFVLSAIVIKYSLIRRITIDIWLGLLCMCLSFSSMAILQSLLFILIVQFKFTFKNIISLIVTFSFMLILFGNKLIDRLQLFIDGDDSSNNAKQSIINVWLSDQNNFLYGFSFVNKYKLGEEFIALGDVSFWLNNFMFFGLVIGFLFLFVYVNKFSSLMKMREKMLFSIIFLKLSTFTYPLMSLVICLFFMLNDRDKDAYPY